jgi:hypothetical protein
LGVFVSVVISLIVLFSGVFRGLNDFVELALYVGDLALCWVAYQWIFKPLWVKSKFKNPPSFDNE